MGCRGCGKKLGVAGRVRRAAINWAMTMPALYNTVQRWRQPADRGLGDTLQHALAALGAEQYKAWLKAWNVDCGCDDEIEFWNERRPYA